jgi:O-methyltransferase involved in polyketide biosynthesis
MAEPRTSISPTAHFTAAVWARNGLSHPALSTHAGRAMYWSSWPLMRAVQGLGGVGLEDFLLARHVLIDQRLELAIESGRVSQVIEVAAGMSPRGWRFTDRYGERITYLETDLPEMVERKRAALRGAGLLGAGHRVEPLDALDESGPRSLGAVAGGLDPGAGVAIITEGLLTYLDRAAVLGLWGRSAEVLARFPDGLMLSDLHLASENRGVTTAIGVRLLSMFVRGDVRMHFEDEDAALAALGAAGFADSAVHRGSEVSDTGGAASIRVIESSTASRAGAARGQQE